MNIQPNLKINNKLADKLANVVDLLIAGKITTAQATAINKVASTSIRATKEGVMTAHHQQIQRDKVAVQLKEQEVKKENIKLQRERIEERQSR